MSEIKLKPCPFCGGKAELRINVSFYGENIYGISCLTEGCIANTMTENFSRKIDAIEAWNRRVE